MHATNRRYWRFAIAERIFTKSLNLTVKEALQFFADAPKIVEKLRVLEEVGLGYLATGAVGHDAFRR